MTIADPPIAMRSVDSSWNYDRWLHLPDDGNRYEVVDGVLHMTTVPGSLHQWVVQRLVTRVGLPAEENDEAIAILGPIAIVMPGCDPVQPDFLLVRPTRIGILEAGCLRGVPDVIVEVASPPYPLLDTRIKRDAYARASVPEYWIVRPASRDILICWQPDANLGDYVQSRLVSSDEELVLPTLGLRVSVGDLFAGAPNTAL